MKTEPDQVASAASMRLDVPIFAECQIGPAASCEDPKKQFGAAVKAIRKRQGLSQHQLAVRSSLHRTYITDIERGKRNVSLESICKVAAALGVSVSALFFSAEHRDYAENQNSMGKQPV